MAGSNHASLVEAGLAIDRAIDQVDPDALAGALAGVPPFGPPAAPPKAPVDPETRARFAKATALDSVRSYPVPVPLPQPADLATWWPRRSAFVQASVDAAAECADLMGEDHDEISASFSAGHIRSTLDLANGESRAYTLKALPRPRSAALARALAGQVPELAKGWRMDPAAAPRPDAKRPLLGNQAAVSDADPMAWRPRWDDGWVEDDPEVLSKGKDASSHTFAEVGATSRGVSGATGYQGVGREGAGLGQTDLGASGSIGVDGRVSGRANASHAAFVTDAAGKATKTGEAKGHVAYDDGAFSAAGEFSHFDGADGYSAGLDVSSA